MPVTINGSGPVTGVTAITGAGLDLITVQTFSAATSVSVNNCFSATYESYRLVVRAIGSTTAQVLAYRMRASGSDNSSSNYAFQVLTVTGTTVSGSRSTAQTSGRLGIAISTDWTGVSADIWSPFLTTATILTSQSIRESVTQVTIEDLANSHNVASAYDGITILPAAGTISGEVRVYGYRNS